MNLPEVFQNDFYSGITAPTRLESIPNLGDIRRSNVGNGEPLSAPYAEFTADIDDSNRVAELIEALTFEKIRNYW